MENALHPPDRFGVVAPQVYRSCVFQPVNFTFLAELKLRTIVHLSPEVNLRAVSNFIKDNDIRLVHLGIKFWKPTGWKPMSEELVKEALELVLDVNNHPLMLMCTSGVHQTGTVVGCLRRLQRVYSFTSIIDELRNFAFPAHTRYANETFIEFFDIDLVSMPESLPSWCLSQNAIHQLIQDEKEKLAALGATDAPAYLRYLGSTTGPLVDKWLKDVESELTAVNDQKSPQKRLEEVQAEELELDEDGFEDEGIAVDQGDTSMPTGNKTQGEILKMMRAQVREDSQTKPEVLANGAILFYGFRKQESES